jgi:hypothetical protein
MNTSKATAGLRGSSWNEERMSKLAYTVRPVPLRTPDSQRTLGFLYAMTGAEDTVVCTMHPREFTGTPYVVPDALEAGSACWVQAPRSIGNDLRLEHEAAILDVAASMVYLRQMGFKRIYLLGISGGAGLYAFYVQQALRAPAERLAKTPGGRPVNLAEADMPVPEGLILLSPHPGQGKLLLNCIDPSVVDENDPYSTDSALDPFNPANGFRAPPASSSYAADFVQRYRAAQIARVERLDALAREIVKTRAKARAAVKNAGPQNPPSALTRKQAAHTPILQVWRTDADLRCWDTALDPSDRKVGSLWGADPYASNWGGIGFGRLVTAESWLSTWSGLSSNASFSKCGPELKLPILMLEYTGDQAAFPADMDEIFASLGSSDKTRRKVRGNHHGQALAKDEESGQVIAGRYIREWIGERT